jgi:hypothetical protein
LAQVLAAAKWADEHHYLEREYRDKHMDRYEDMIRNTATPAAPWNVVPADHKWFTRVVAVAAIVGSLKELKVSYPKVDEHEPVICSIHERLRRLSETSDAACIGASGGLFSAKPEVNRTSR